MFPGRKDTYASDVTIITAIVHPPVIAKILAHLGLPIRAPPPSPARHFALMQTA
ncbi:MAG: hypothetical protein L0Z46_07435 [Nitrospiraceae bacterium]|nr:hypothetical protein [Nitrospiraceae bacterium]